MARADHPGQQVRLRGQEGQAVVNRGRAGDQQEPDEVLPPLAEGWGSVAQHRLLDEKGKQLEKAAEFVAR